MAINFNLAIIGTFLFTISLCSDGLAQSEAETITAKNTLSVELGGNAGRYALSYGRLFHQNGSFKLSGSVGFSMWHENVLSSTYWNPALPLEITALFGRSKHHMEFGLGLTPYLENSYDFDPSGEDMVKNSNHLNAILPLRLGYRYQKPEGGFFFRAGYTPLIFLPIGVRETLHFYPLFAGLSFGKSF
ncbi:hypothetical protein [Aquiflexum sp.]|uniref:hypothetical protein n=1 Tax=Aquiflexum sp. TaxID=1872584 RepID=UPI0035936B8A